MNHKITAQINLAPSDYPLSRTLLPRQIEVVSAHVDEIVLSLDTKRGSGRFASAFKSHERAMRELVEDMQRGHPGIVLRPVDYSQEAQERVSAYFKQRRAIPLRDLRGGPSYVYFFGLWSCKNDFVFHIDADMFFGGSPEGWFSRATTCLSREGIFSVAPLPGPPAADGRLLQPLLDQRCIAEDRAARVYAFDGFSTRVFLTDRRKFANIRLRGRLGPLRTAKALGRNLEPFELPEVMITRHMRRHGLRRVDFGGEGDFYTLHPPHKSTAFFEEAERIWNAVAADRVPIGQRGRYDISDDLYDFSAERRALAAQAWHRRLSHRILPWA